MAGKRPVVHGNERTFVAELRKRLRKADDFSGRLASARELRAAAPPVDPKVTGLAAGLQGFEHRSRAKDLEDAIAKWQTGNENLLKRFLGAGAADYLVPVQNRRVFELPELRDFETRLQTAEARLASGREEVERLLDLLSVPDEAPSRGPEERFAELRNATLIQQESLNSYVNRMSKTRNTVQIRDAIGASKELVEACHRAACRLLDVEYPEGDFTGLGKTVRKALAERESAGLSTKTANAVHQLMGGMTTVEFALATLRNDVGAGHGQPELPTGLKPRHAALAIDVAETHTRYLVGTLRDLKLI